MSYELVKINNEWWIMDVEWWMMDVEWWMMNVDFAYHCRRFSLQNSWYPAGQNSKKSHLTNKYIDRKKQIKYTATNTYTKKGKKYFLKKDDWDTHIYKFNLHES